jgi:hypothetical protein
MRDKTLVGVKAVVQDWNSQRRHVDTQLMFFAGKRSQPITRYILNLLEEFD